MEKKTVARIKLVQEKRRYNNRLYKLKKQMARIQCTTKQKYSTLGTTSEAEPDNSNKLHIGIISITPTKRTTVETVLISNADRRLNYPHNNSKRAKPTQDRLMAGTSRRTYEQYTTKRTTAPVNNSQNQSLPNKNHYLTNRQENDEITKSPKGKHPQQYLWRAMATNILSRISTTHQREKKIQQNFPNSDQSSTNKKAKHMQHPKQSSYNNRITDYINPTRKEVARKQPKHIYHPAYRTLYFKYQNNSARNVNINALTRTLTLH
ncbi:hypothetical protein CHS0354_009475 [Potamilus streckersoni]|uniref:Uncharacterized protein n=1 Tax=Potamilus streckersoni TaxID=2493646 RepID=A0AAE0RVR9_9BIVA|nr:hypothetical protein CHS0354_009475 [Potamilus streckersoni]